MITAAVKTGYTLTLVGKSGHKYVFELYPGIPSTGKVGALYLFTHAETVDANHNLIYLGITEDLSSRFDNHHKAKCIQDNGANFLGILLMADKASRVNAEADILAVRNMTCNDKMN